MRVWAVGFAPKCSGTASARSWRSLMCHRTKQAALTGHTEAVWWKSYVQPRRDAESRRENIEKMTARGLGVLGEVDQRLTSA